MPTRLAERADAPGGPDPGELAGREDLAGKVAEFRGFAEGLADRTERHVLKRYTF